MIALIDPGDPRLEAAVGNPLILAAIQALAKTVGPGLRRELWLVEEDQGVMGAVCRTESGLLATASGEAAAWETAAFLEMMGYFPATVDGELARLLSGDWQRFPVLRYEGRMPDEIRLCPPSAMALANCCVAAGIVEEALRDELYAELHLRMRRKAAQVFLVPGEDGAPAAGACVLLGEKYAVIGYLACLPEKRRQGYGTAALLAAVREAMGAQKIPLLACRKGLVDFYRRRGFSPVDEVWERSFASRPSAMTHTI